jgi:hypothetical protein
LSKWLECFKELCLYSRESSQAALSFVVNHEANSSFIRHYLLECPVIEIREACGQLFEYFLSSFVTKFEQNPLDNMKITSLITSLIHLLDKAVIDLCKNSYEYFKLLFVYANMSMESVQQLISLGLFNKLLCFLLGNPGSIKTATTSSESSSSSSSSSSENNRRWSSLQYREFSIVHELIASLVLKCNLLTLRTCDLPKTVEKPLEAEPVVAYDPMTPTDNIPLIDFDKGNFYIFIFRYGFARNLLMKKKSSLVLQFGLKRIFSKSPDLFRKSSSQVSKNCFLYSPLKAILKIRVFCSYKIKIAHLCLFLN